MFNSHPQDVIAKSWHDPQAFAPRYDDLEDDELVTRARNSEALARYGFHPYVTHAETEKSIKLFAREVLPRLKEIALVQAGFNQQ